MLSNTPEIQSLLILAAFCAAALSFWPSRLSTQIVRGVVFTIGVLGFLLVAAGTAFGIGMAAGFAGGRSSITTDATVFGAVLVGVYFVLGSLCCLPFIPTRRLRPFGLIIHFILLPIALILVCMDFPFDEFWLRIFSLKLQLGLVYALLWFRMCELRQHSQTIA